MVCYLHMDIHRYRQIDLLRRHIVTLQGKFKTPHYHHTDALWNIPTFLMLGYLI